MTHANHKRNTITDIENIFSSIADFHIYRFRNQLLNSISEANRQMFSDNIDEIEKYLAEVFVELGIDL